MGKRFTRAIVLRRREIVVLTAFAVLLAGVFSYTDERSVFSSAETRFVEYSESGLQIIPASCPSGPHYSGQCSGAAPPGGQCSLTASPYLINAGGASTLSWQIPPEVYYADFDGGSSQYTIYSAVIDHGVGSVGASGSTSVSPSETTRYRLTVEYRGGIGSQTVRCSATVTVAATSCPAGYHLSNGVCIHDACPSGYSLQNGQCIRICGPADAGCTPDVYVFPDSQGNSQSYYQSYYQSSYCTTQYQCSSDSKRVINSCNPAGTVQTCSASETCVSGGCIGIDATIKAVPNLLRPGETSNITWSGSNVSSCTVTEDNPDIFNTWSCNSAATCSANHSNMSSPINEETKYTIVCTAPSGATVTKSAVINIVPVWIED